jgi:hypothetical protein
MAKRSFLLTGAGLLGSAVLYGVLLYLTPRMAFGQLLTLFGGLMLLYLGLMWLAKQEPELKWLRRGETLLLLGMAFRLIALFALPLLSDDYFRFVWDGRLLAAGVNPFELLPSEYLAQPQEMARLGLTEELFAGLNSPEYFTIYPPVLQAIFWLGAWLFPTNLYGHVIVMKAVVVLAEGGSLYLLLRLLRVWQKPEHWLGWYALNPLVIVELSGNLHFEALMIFGLIWAVWEWQQGRWMRAAIPFALAVASKLLPLMFMPLLIRRLGWQRSFLWGLMVAALCLLMAWPLFDLDTIQNLLQSIDLYFRKFEFNASVYYLVRWVGYQVMGYNIIQHAGPVLGGITVLGILAISFWEKQPDFTNLPRAMMWALGLYLLFASIVHPWYVCTLVALGSPGRYRFAMIWSGLAILSYATYRTTAYEESLGLVAVEYLLVAGWLVWEWRGGNQGVAGR